MLSKLHFLNQEANILSLILFVCVVVQVDALTSSVMREIKPYIAVQLDLIQTSFNASQFVTPVRQKSYVIF